MSILVTGGAGYIGSHTLIELLNANYEVLVLDNLCNSNRESLYRVEKITQKKIPFIQGDILDTSLLHRLFQENKITAVIHFAGLKAVADSVNNPLHYYQTNISGTLSLCQAMKKAAVKTLIFSSSATVYGNPASLPITEIFPVHAINPYGQSKRMVEEILADWCQSEADLKVTCLRYFNPVGAHSSGLIGEDPRGIPNNLMPFISQVASGKRKKVYVFGNDYPTPDGTGVRDYIHVVDLAKGHIKALEYSKIEAHYSVYNLGTGKAYSVLELIKTFEKVSGKKIPYTIAPRREGDIAACYANADNAKRELHWQSQYDLESMVKSSWLWQSKNPHGYSL
jgi:UDP-glucose 4-epimerase